MTFDIRRSSILFDELFDLEKPRCFVRPIVRPDPEHPNYLYLEYGVKAQNYQDTTAFWREHSTLKLPHDEYTMLEMEWQRKQSLDSKQHPFLPRRQSIYAQTALERHVASAPDVPLGDYVRGSRDDICIAPWLIMGSESPHVESTRPECSAPREPEPLCDVAIDFSGFSFGVPSAGNDLEHHLLPSYSASSSSDSSSSSSRSECSTPATTPEHKFTLLPRRSQSPDRRRSSRKHRASSFLAPSSSGSDDDYEDDAYERTPKRKHVSAPRKAPTKRARTSAQPSPSPTVSSNGDIIHPPLPTEPNARGRWSCPYEGCTHETSAFGDLQRHLESLAHTPEKRHRCATCGCTFTRVDALKRHQVKRPERCKMIARGQIKAT